MQTGLFTDTDPRFGRRSKKGYTTVAGKPCNQWNVIFWVFSWWISESELDLNQRRHIANEFTVRPHARASTQEEEIPD